MVASAEYNIKYLEDLGCKHVLNSSNFVDLKHFYEEKSEGKGINGLRRLSRQAEGIRKVHAKQISTSEKAIMSDVLDGSMSPEDGKLEIEALKEEKPDYSSVGEHAEAE